MVLKKEVMKTQSRELEKGAEYRHLLVHAIHECAAGFPDIAASVIHLLMDFLGDANSASALDVIFFVREIMVRRARPAHNVVFPPPGLSRTRGAPREASVPCPTASGAAPGRASHRQALGMLCAWAPQRVHDPARPGCVGAAWLVAAIRLLGGGS